MPHRRSSPTSRLGAALVLGALLLTAVPAAGQRPEEPDFLFERPTVHLSAFGGLFAPRAESEIFDFVSERLTVDEGDFRSISLGAGFGFRATERLDVALELEFTQAETSSEFREWEDTDGRPIEQTTRLTRMPLTVTLRAYLWERGRRVGRFAWVPRAWTAYVGAGGGLVGYEFRQEGDFVDFQTLEVFRDRFRSRGTVPTGHVLAGAEASLSPRLVVTGEGRYAWASAPMEGDFEGFDEIDLTGLRATVGISVRF